MPPLHQLSTAQLRQALQLSEQIDTLQRQLETILGGAEPGLLASSDKPKKGGGKQGRGGKRSMSPEGREKIAAAARLRWANLRTASGKSTAAKAKPEKAKGKVVAVGKKSGGTAAKKPAATAAASQKRRNLTPEGREKLSAAMKARWEARKKGEAE